MKSLRADMVREDARGAERRTASRLRTNSLCRYFFFFSSSTSGDQVAVSFR